MLTNKLILTILILFFASVCESAWYSSDWQNRQSITIDSSKVSATLTDFPVVIDITDSNLINKAQADADDFLFTSSDGVTKLDHEIEMFHTYDGHLVAWVEIPSLSSSVDTVIYMYYNNSSVSSQENATGVWDSNFQTVHHFDDLGQYINQEDSTSNNNDMTLSGNPDFADISSLGDDINSHQGFAYDGTDYYGFDTNTIYRYNSSWVQQDINSDPSGDTCPTCNHLGDGDVYNGTLYIPIQKWNSCVDEDSVHIAEFNASTLDWVTDTSIDSLGWDAASVYVDANAGTNGIIYVVSYCDNYDRIHRLDLSDYSDLGDITMSGTISGMQGITIYEDDFYISADSQSSGSSYSIWIVESDGNILGEIKGSGSVIQGMETVNGTLGALIDSGANEQVAFLLFSEKLGRGMNFDGSTDFTSLTYTYGDNGTISFWFYPNSFFDYNTLFDNSVDANDWEGWIYNDGRVAARVDAGVSGYDLDNLSGVGNWYKFDFTWDRTGNKVMYVNGVARETSAVTWATPGTTVYFGGGNSGNTDGDVAIDEMRISDIERSTDFITTSYNNESDPSSFYTVGSEEVVPITSGVILTGVSMN